MPTKHISHSYINRNKKYSKKKVELKVKIGEHILNRVKENRKADLLDHSLDSSAPLHLNKLETNLYFSILLLLRPVVFIKRI